MTIERETEQERIEEAFEVSSRAYAEHRRQERVLEWLNYHRRREVSDEYPRKHERNPTLGISEEVARELDTAAWEMQQGGIATNDVVHDPSSETYENLHQADIGRNTYSRHEGISSNEQILFATLVEREKNADPDIEHEEAYSRAVDKLNAMQGNNDKEEK